MAAGRKTGGRTKGTPNKQTAAIKDMIVQALDKAGGVEYLLTQANANPSAFLTLVGKIIPTQLTGEDGAPIKVEQLKQDADAISSLLVGLAARIGTDKETGKSYH